MTVVERFKEDSMYGLSARNVAVVERWPSVEVRLCTKGYFFLSKMVWLKVEPRGGVFPYKTLLSNYPTPAPEQ